MHPPPAVQFTRGPFILFQEFSERLAYNGWVRKHLSTWGKARGGGGAGVACRSGSLGGHHLLATHTKHQ